MIEHRSIDMARMSDFPAGVIHFTATDDLLWAGVVVLKRGGSFALNANARHDVYVLRGSIRDGDTVQIEAGDFASRYAAGTLHAGDDGAVLFIYREPSTDRRTDLIQPARQRAWHDAKAAGMHVSLLSDAGHRLTMVEWEPGAHTREHAHPNGEEIFVLSGELRSKDERYPAGTWLRLHPGSHHEPYADVPTVILLRNGHMRMHA